MKTFRLSSRSERIAGISFSVVAILCFAVLLYALRNNLSMLILCGLCALVVSAMLVFYIVNVLKSAVVAHPESKTLEVLGIPSYTVDLSNAALLQTLPRKTGRTMSRVLVFSDKDENILATVPTMFTSKQGILADPMAKELAQALDIPFRQNVADWELDRKLYQQHQKEVAAEEKKAAKARREAKAAYRVQKKKNKLSGKKK